MDRETAYHLEVPAQSDFLLNERFAYEGLCLALMDILGQSTLVAGLACTPTSPASLAVNVGPGRIYVNQPLEPTAWGLFGGTGGLPVDTNPDHNLMKQGIVRDTQALAVTTPGSVGQSINYLVQIGFLEQDTATVSRSFYNVAAPGSPITNAVSPSRIDLCNVQIKAGLAATTGTQVTPAPDTGFVGMWVVNVAYGATTIIAGNITPYAGAPLVLTQPQILALIAANYGPANPPTIPNVTGLVAALAAITPGLAQAAIVGMGISNTISTPLTQITVAVGSCRDSTNTTDIVVAAPITKSISSVWAAGSTGQGCRDNAGAYPINSYAHVFAIWNTTGPTIDILTSQSATAPTLPTGYTKFRRIGSILTDASGNVRQFVQVGRSFELVTRTVDFASGTNNGSGVSYLRQLFGVPIGVKVRPMLLLQSTGTVDGSNYFSGYYDPDKGTPAAFGGSTQWAQIRRGSFYQYPGTYGCYGYYLGSLEACSASGQIYTFSSDASDLIAIGCLGWIDDQGGYN
jgi:hypothetical protein